METLPDMALLASMPWWADAGVGGIWYPPVGRESSGSPPPGWVALHQLPENSTGRSNLRPGAVTAEGRERSCCLGFRQDTAGALTDPSSIRFPRKHMVEYTLSPHCRTCDDNNTLEGH
ncbi:hypothetical protein Pcinc_027607 [Petrolisthes cinctipes]|uniref:Uncharacterized protein n=1 Tax=Petrolisthes cinctipes TaxID=88211 RepID=A0AAE1F512_PETCI|nr:hypothetical protein Pcinc_027607 [Petrolisthes cinctipes]